MARSFVVTINGDMSDREAEKVKVAIQKSVAKWFKKGHAVKVDEA